MGFPSPRWWPWAGLLLLGGCLSPVREHVDQVVCNTAAQPVDVQPLPPADAAPLSTAPDKSGTRGLDPSVQPAGFQEPGTATEVPRRLTLSERLKIPAGLPGAHAPPIPALPRYNRENNQPREDAINRLYPDLPALGPEPTPAPGPNGHPLTLAELQALALANSPLIRQAAARVEAAEGAAKQAGAYPNPTVGYEADTAGTGATAGYQGVFFDQVIKTAGKLKLTEAAALIDVLNARLDYRKAQADLATQVRANYFQVLVGRESVRVSRELITLADSAYAIQVGQLRTGLVAPYEPLQLRVLALQARGVLITSRASYLANWKQLAATLGLPGLPLTKIAGNVDMPVPVYQYDAALARVLAGHTDVLEADNNIRKARFNLRLAQVTPIPDVNLHLVLQKDYTTPPFSIVDTVQVGLPVPLWDQNRGGIRQAQGNLLVNIEEPHRVRDDLTSRLADAFQRYEANRALVEYYRSQILPDQVRAYRGIYERHNIEPGSVSFGDIVTAQQTLATAITTYVTTLGALWQSVTDIAGLLQTSDLFQVGGASVPSECVAPIPDLAHVAPLPCEHPCSPLPDPALKNADPTWPPAVGPSGELLKLPAQERSAPSDRPPATPPEANRNALPLDRSRHSAGVPEAPEVVGVPEPPPAIPRAARQ